MSQKGYSRRAVTVGGGIAAALGLAALGITVPRLFGRHYRKTPYDDLFAQLVDRDAAVKVGAAARAQGAPVAAARLAKEVQQRLDRRALAVAVNADLAESRLAEVKGWVLPETLVLLCELAALES
ncbi:MAG: hypothetical protein WDM86_04335 [Rhizomicrobium sp.]